MNFTPDRESLQERIRRSAIRQEKSKDFTPVVFREQKRPKFIIQKSPHHQSHPGNAASGDEGARTTKEPFSKRPRFVTNASRAPNENVGSNSPRLSSLISSRKRMNEEEIDNDPELPSDKIHNPFNVSDELEEPVASPISQRHMSKRFVTLTSTKGQPGSIAGTSNKRSTSDVLSSIKFSRKGAQMDHSPVGVHLTSDWSPHKRRGKTQLEKDKFLPGGMAETVALWIYEEQCRVEDDKRVRK